MESGGNDPWGEHQPPAISDPPPLPPRLAELAALDGPLQLPPGERFVRPRPEDLPEVVELMGEGWRVAEHSPMWSFLPAVWPESLRCWVPDRLPRLSRSGGEDEPVEIIPWTPEVVADMRRWDIELLERVGFPPPPTGRIWLLRSPWPTIGVERVVSLIALRAREQGGGDMLDPVLVEAAREVLSWDEERVWDWWPGPGGEVARAWRARGRVGEDAAPVIAARLDPDLLAEYEASGLDEAAALAWTSTLYMYGEEGLERALAWIRLGQSPEEMRDLRDADPAEVARWLAEGFGLDDVRALDGLPLESALAWRASGFAASQVRRLLRADHTLTPPEAARFDGVGIEDALPWIELGFDAAAARAWTDLDVLPNEARVWRAAGHDPESAAPLLAEIPPGAPRIPHGAYASSSGGWTSRLPLRPGERLDLSDPEVRASLHYSVHDPPGTRGSAARLQRHLEDPASD